jgi:uncharacterized cysteine cluster protein YcgN (CxxCxxCC family)
LPEDLQQFYKQIMHMNRSCMTTTVAELKDLKVLPEDCKYQTEKEETSGCPARSSRDRQEMNPDANASAIARKGRAIGIGVNIAANRSEPGAVSRSRTKFAHLVTGVVRLLPEDLHQFYKQIMHMNRGCMTTTVAELKDVKVLPELCKYKTLKEEEAKDIFGKLKQKHSKLDKTERHFRLAILLRFPRTCFVCDCQRVIGRGKYHN